MSLMHAFAPNPAGSSNIFPFRDPSMMRQESPSPNSSLSSCTFAAAKPPTPTSSPKLRRRTVSGGSDQSLVRQNLDFAGEEEAFEPAPEHSSGRPGPVVQDKRRCAAPEPPPAWRDPPGSEPPSPSAPSRSRVNSKCVKRTQSLKEQLVNFFTKNSAHSSSSSPSGSPTAAADRMDRAAVMPTGHAPVIRSSRRSSRIPQYTGSLSNGASPAHAPQENGEAQVALYSARHFGPDDVRSSDEHGSICFDVHSSGRGELRVVKDPEASPFRSHPVDRCGVVVPSAPSSSSKLPFDAPELDSVRQGSPSGPPDSALPPASKKSAPRVMDFERQNAAELPQRWTRGGSMRNVQVLPDKKVRREKTASSENLMTAVNDAVDSAQGFVPRPPIVKRHSTDSEDNIAAAAAAESTSASLPPRRRCLLAKKPQDAAGYTAHLPRSSPMAIEIARGSASPSNDFNLLVTARPDEPHSSDADSPTEDLTSATLVPGASDGSDTSHNGINGAISSGPFASALRSRSNSLDCLGAENPTMPQIRNPSRRVRPSKHSDVPPGSPPKTVSWNLVPDVLKYDKEASEASGSSRRSHRSHRRHRSDGGRGSTGMIARTTSDERIYDPKKGITNSTLIAVHESFLEQMTNILKQEMELLEEVKQEKKSMTVYREVMQKILILKAQTVKQMQDILEQHEG